MADNSGQTLLSVSGLDAWYGRQQVLRGVDLEVHAGEIVGLFGHNGAGKSTLLKSIVGVEATVSGSIQVEGREVSKLSRTDPARSAVGIVPQGVGVFGTLRVRENVMLSAGSRRKHSPTEGDVGKSLERLPVVVQRWDEYARRLSGGQRQMVSIARSLVQGVRLLLLDEPSIGLSPRMTAEVMGLVQAIRDEGIGVLIVEQVMGLVVPMMDRGYIIRSGEVVMEGPKPKFENQSELLDYF